MRCVTPISELTGYEERCTINFFQLPYIMSTKTKKSNKYRSKDTKSIAQSQGTGNGQENTRTESGLSLEAENQFEVELCWCIQHLQATLESAKLPEKQLLDLKRNLNALRSNSASLIRKRQIMRNTLGDYRQKMIEEERKFGKAVHYVKFTCKPHVGSKSVFLRRALTAIPQEQGNENSHARPIDDVGNVTINDTETEQTHSLDKSFRFNFNSSV